MSNTHAGLKLLMLSGRAAACSGAAIRYFQCGKLEFGLEMLAFAQHHRARTSPVAAVSAFRAPLVAVALAMSSGYADASDPTGLWLVEDGSAKVRVQACGDALCGNVHWIKQPNDSADGMP